MVDDADKSRDTPSDSPDGAFAADGSPRRRPRPAPTIDLHATDVTPPEAAPHAGKSGPTENAPSGEDAAQAADAVRAAMLSMSTRESARKSEEISGKPDSVRESPAMAQTAEMHGGESKTENPHGAADSDPAADVPRRLLLPDGFTFAMLEAGAAGGALVLLVLAVLWFSDIFQHGDDGARGIDEKMAAFNTRLHDVETRPAPAAQNSAALDGLGERLGQLEAAVAAIPAPSPQTGAPSNTALKSITDALAQLGRRNDDIAAAVREARGRADAAITAADAAKTAARNDDLAPLTQRVAALEKTIKDMKDAADVSAKRDAASSRSVRLLFAAQALRGALDRGEAYAGDLSAVKSLLAAPRDLAALDAFADKGLPSAFALARDLHALAPAITAAQTGGATADDKPQGSGFLGRLQANAERLVSVRAAGETAADDPRAVLAQAHTKADRGDIAGALGDLQSLPAPMQAPAAAWIKTASDRDKALALARVLTSDAAAALSSQP